MSEQFQGNTEDPEKLFRIRQGLEAERAQLTDLYGRFLEGQLGRDERIQLRVDLEQRVKKLRGEVWDRQETPLIDPHDKATITIPDLFASMVQLEDQIVVLRARADATS